MEQNMPQLKKYFKNQELPDFSVTQSPYIHMDGDRYAIIGQFTLHSFLFSHFDVLDQYGNRADHDTGQKMYRYIAMIQLSAFMAIIQEWMNDSGQTLEDDAAEIREEFKNQYGHDIKVLLEGNRHIRHLLQELIVQRGALGRLEEWNEKDLLDFEPVWDDFWDTYEERMKVLFDFRKFIWQNDKNVQVQETSLKNLYLEANEMYQLFSESLPADQPLITEMDDFLQVTEELGRVSTQENHNQLLTTFERFSMHFFQRMYQFLLWICFPVSLIVMVSKLWLDGSFTKSPFTFLVLAFVFLTAHLTDKHARKTKMTHRYKQQREARLGEHAIIRSKYYQAYQDMQVEQMKMKEEQYEFIATPTVLWRGMLFAGIMIVIMGYGLLDSDLSTHDYGYGYIAVGSILLVLRLILPLLGVAHIRFRLTPEGLQRGKKKTTYISNIFEVAVNKKGSIFALDLGMQYRQKFKIKKAYRQHTKEQLKVWCDKYDLDYKNKLYFWEIGS